MSRPGMSPEKTLLDVLDQLNCGGLLLDRSGSVLQFNAVAERCFERHAEVQKSRDKGWATRALRQLLGKVIGRKQSTTPVALPNDAWRPIVAHMVSLPNAEDQPSRTLLVLLDLDECLRPDPELLRQVFHLTNAEARLAARLACGACLEEIAEAHGISIGTARAQLKAIFAKTQTSRQAELAVLISRLALASGLERLSDLILSRPRSASHGPDAHRLCSE